MPEPRVRALLKISGESLTSGPEHCFELRSIDRIAGEIVACVRGGVELAIVIGGGNLFRGKELAGTAVLRDTADRMGMLATVMNALAFRDVLEDQGCPSRILTGIPVPEVGETFTARRAEAVLSAGEVLLCAGGTGHPYFTTDTAAALRAVELRASLLLKATKFDGIFAEDPAQNPAAERYDRITYDECMQKRLAVMDQTAFALCRENALPIVVFDMNEPGRILAAALGESVGTRVVPA